MTPVGGGRKTYGGDGVKDVLTRGLAGGCGVVPVIEGRQVCEVVLHVGRG